MDITLIEDLLCREAVDEICTIGNNDEAVMKWLQYYLYDLGKLNICPFACKAMLKGYDFAPVYDKMQLMERALWVAAWNVKEREGG